MIWSTCMLIKIMRCINRNSTDERVFALVEAGFGFMHDTYHSLLGLPGRSLKNTGHWQCKCR